MGHYYCPAASLSTPPHLPSVTCGSVLIHSHMRNFFGSLSLAGRPSWKALRAAVGSRRCLGMNADPRHKNEAAGRVSMSRPARLWAGPPDPSQPLFLWLWAWLRRKTQGGERNEVPATTQTMNAHQCLRMLSLSSRLNSHLPHRSHPSQTPPPRSPPGCLRVGEHASLAIGRRAGPRCMSHFSTPPPHPPTTCFVTVKCCRSAGCVLLYFWPPC